MTVWRGLFRKKPEKVDEVFVPPAQWFEPTEEVVTPPEWFVQTETHEPVEQVQEQPVEQVQEQPVEQGQPVEEPTQQVIHAFEAPDEGYFVAVTEDDHTLLRLQAGTLQMTLRLSPKSAKRLARILLASAEE